MGLEALLFVAVIGLGALFADDTKETIVLLPDEDGGIGALAVNPGTDEMVLDSAGQAALIGDSIRTTTLSDAEIAATFGEAIDARPQPARSYILYFEEGSTRLESGSESVLNDLFADLEKRAAPDVSIIGHTDRVGSIEANDRLALQRAKVVLQWMAEKGIDKTLMDAAGRGEREPLVNTADGVEEAKNRRVEISIR